MQLKLAQVLGDHGHHAGVVRTRGYLAEQHRIPLDEQLYPENAIAAQGGGDHLRLTLRLSQGCR